jgi:hypothetical protein
MTELIERKLTGVLFGYRIGTKTTTDVMRVLDALKKINPLLADDYEKKYIALARAKNR